MYVGPCKLHSYRRNVHRLGARSFPRAWKRMG
jgi:hypothetical protein